MTQKEKQEFMVRNLLLQFREDQMSGFQVIANNVSANQVLDAALIFMEWSKKKIEQDFMVRNLIFQFREDQMSGFQVMANNISATQVPAA